LLSNVASSVLDEHIAQAPGGAGTDANERRRRRRRGRPNYRLVRYADDWCLLVHGTKADAEALRDQIADVLSALGLRLSPEKTMITHIEQGLDFLGWRIQRHRKPGTNRYYVYVPSTRPRRPSGPSWPRSRCGAGRSARTSRSMPC
jgi:RNA-directed DNA polymerase